MILSRPLRPVLLLVAVLATGPVAARDPEAELEALRERIGKVQQELETTTTRRDKAQRELAQSEREVAAARASLTRTRRSLEEARARLGEMAAERAAARARLEVAREGLAAQVRAAWMGGRQGRMRLLLDRQDPAELGRLLVYYGYVSEVQAERIAGVLAALDRLQAVERARAAEKARLEALEGRHAAELAALEGARADRARAVARLDAALRGKAGEVAGLKAEAQALEKLVTELQRAVAEMPGADRAPFAEQRGRLSWPVEGRVVSDFGQPRAGGELRWNGLLLGTERGAQVRAVYHGRVAYADWLPGLGLLMVIDHGDGWLSLYGHNESLFRDVGDWVAPGEVIAAAGDSGGRSGAALYFEIRKGTTPQDPHRFLRRR